MKGLFPSWFRIAGYAFLLLSVFIPLSMYMFSMVTDDNLLHVKLGMKAVIWISLFMIFFSKTKDETVHSSLRMKAIKASLWIWAAYYLFMLIRAAIIDSPSSADSSCAIIFMIISVICMEFLFQKHRAEQLFKRR